MFKKEILKTIKEEDKILIARILDKLEMCLNKNMLIITDFLNLYEKEIITKTLKTQKVQNYFFYGGYDDAERTVLAIYPNSYTQKIRIKCSERKPESN